jgi:hypothetical protein
VLAENRKRVPPTGLGQVARKALAVQPFPGVVVGPFQGQNLAHPRNGVGIHGQAKRACYVFNGFFERALDQNAGFGSKARLGKNGLQVLSTPRTSLIKHSNIFMFWY